jgi:hypothetical protein
MQNTIPRENWATKSDSVRQKRAGRAQRISKNAPPPEEVRSSEEFETKVDTQPVIGAAPGPRSLELNEFFPPVHEWSTVEKRDGFLQVSQSFIGVIDDIEGNIIYARVCERHDDPDFDTTVTFGIEDLKPSDRRIVAPGSIFYAFTGVQRTPKGDIYVNEIRLRRLVRKRSSAT